MDRIYKLGYCISCASPDLREDVEDKDLEPVAFLLQSAVSAPDAFKHSVIPGRDLASRLREEGFAGVAVFLASRASDFVTGSTVIVDRWSIRFGELTAMTRVN